MLPITFNFIILQVTNLAYGEYPDFMKEFSEMLNFQVRKFRRKDGAWGVLNSETGQWSGMISNLINKEADLISQTITQCCGRSEYIDFLWTLTEGSSGFIIKGIGLNIDFY